MKPPPVIDGAKVICYSPIDERHRFTGNCKQIADSQILGSLTGLAICQYPDAGGYYLFGCDAAWEGITDTLHDTLDEAKRQAEFEYAGSKDTWIQGDLF